MLRVRNQPEQGVTGLGGRFGHEAYELRIDLWSADSLPGWSVDEDGGKTWPLNRYLLEGPRTTDWLASGVVKHHRTIGTTLNLLIRSGFVVEHVEEFCPTSAQIAARPELADEVERPMFLIVRARVAAGVRSF